MPVDMSQIPVETQQALATQQGAGNNITDIQTVLAQLAQDPQALAAAMQQLGLNVTAEQLQQVAEDWVDGAAESASGSTDREPQSTTAAGGDSDASESASAPPAQLADGDVDDASTDGEMGADEAAMPAAGMPQDAMVAGNDPASMGSVPAMANVNPMDELISAQLMQRAAGNPNVAVPPSVGGRGKNARMPLKGNRGGPSQQQMIADLYRQVAARQQQPRR